jgi:hypothetical protein
VSGTRARRRWSGFGTGGACRTGACGWNSGAAVWRGLARGQQGPARGVPGGGLARAAAAGVAWAKGTRGSGMCRCSVTRLERARVRQQEEEQ